MTQLQSIGNETLQAWMITNDTNFLAAFVEGRFLSENSYEQRIWQDYATPILVVCLGFISIYT